MSQPAKSATIVLFSGEVDKAMAAFVIATGAAAMGMEVTIFFTFWGLNCLRRPGKKRARSKSVAGRALAALTPAGPTELPLSHLDMMGLGRKLLAGVMKQKGIAALPALMEMARQLGVRLVACQMSMEAFEIRKDDFAFADVEVAGVATYLAAAGASGLNLFV